MNNRDPFSLRHPSTATPLAFLRGGADFATRSVTQLHQKVEQYSAQLLDVNRGSSSSSPSLEVDLASSPSSPSSGMSNATPRHTYVPEDISRQQEPWQQPRNGSGVVNGMGEKMHDLFASKSRDELPMYKDKPNNYAASGRKLPLWRRQRLLLSILGVFALMVYWFGGQKTVKNVTSTFTPSGSPSKWADRQERVREAFRLSWKAYETNAWGMDEYHPVSENGRNMVQDGMGWIIVDALDTMILMNLTTELNHAREWMSTSLSYEKDHDVNTFETTIRMLGGLLSAHYLSNTFPNMAPVPALGSDDDDFYLEKAGDLANRLMAAYDSKSGIPYASINLHTHQGIESHTDGGDSSTAEAATLQLEMKYLAKLTGETSYWEVAEKVMKVIDDNGVRDGLVPIYINANSGQFSGYNIRLGSRGDSYYEYLIKQYLQTSKQEPVYLELWNEALAGINKHLITYSEKAGLTVLGERPNGLDHDLFPKMDHLVCFMPGTIALGATGGKTEAEARKSSTWGAKQDAEMELARQLMKTCWGMYKVTATGLSPEIAHFHTTSDRQRPTPTDPKKSNDYDLPNDPSAPWRSDYDIHTQDYHNLQRPETIESLFYMWRITRDPLYRDIGWKIFESFTSHTFVSAASGFSSINNVDVIPTHFRDNMESFWLAETLKYFFLLFADERDEVLPLDDVVFNTEAHPFPKFEMGKLFTTGWSRLPRDKDGKIVHQEKRDEPP